MSDELLTPQEAAAVLGVAAQTLAIWRCKKRFNLRYIKVGAQVRYRRRDIDRFLNERTVTPGQVHTRN